VPPLPSNQGAERGEPLRRSEHCCMFASSRKSSAWGVLKTKAPVMVLLALLLPPHTPPCCGGSSPWLGTASGGRRDAGSLRVRMDGAASRAGEALISATQHPAFHIHFIPSHFDFLWV